MKIGPLCIQVYQHLVYEVFKLLATVAYHVLVTLKHVQNQVYGCKK